MFYNRVYHTVLINIRIFKEQSCRHIITLLLSKKSSLPIGSHISESCFSHYFVCSISNAFINNMQKQQDSQVEISYLNHKSRVCSINFSRQTLD